MILTHEYRILPSDDQAALMTEWLELLRRQWNDALGQRLDWLTATRCPIDRCSLVSCPLPVSEPPLEPNYYRQAGSLKQIKQLFPAYRGIYAEVLQQNLMRLDKAWKAWREPDSTGKRRGRPRFKKAGELRSFTFPRINCPKAGAHLVGETLRLSKIGSMPVVLHRPLPEGFVPKTAQWCARPMGGMSASAWKTKAFLSQSLCRSKGWWALMWDWIGFSPPAMGRWCLSRGTTAELKSTWLDSSGN